MNPPEEHRLYEVILKQVLWGESEAKIRKKLAVNEIPEEEAEAIYQAALRERAATIRKEYRGRINQGVTSLAVGVGLFSLFWLRLGFISTQILWAVGFFLVVGLWKTTQGGVGYLSANKQQGSVADEF